MDEEDLTEKSFDIKKIEKDYFNIQGDEELQYSDQKDNLSKKSVTLVKSSTQASLL